MESASLYQALLMERFEALPEALKRFHGNPSGTTRWQGKVDVQRGSGFVIAILCSALRLPATMKGADLAVRIRAEAGEEIWERTFAGSRMMSKQRRIRSGSQHYLEETVSGIAGIVDLTLEDQKLIVNVIGWKLLGLPMPAFLRPKGRSFEYEKHGHFHFYVEISIPLFGTLITYEGFLLPEEN